jgi:hypothetical protein
VGTRCLGAGIAKGSRAIVAFGTEASLWRSLNFALTQVVTAPKGKYLISPCEYKLQDSVGGDFTCPESIPAERQSHFQSDKNSSFIPQYNIFPTGAWYKNSKALPYTFAIPTSSAMPPPSHLIRSLSFFSFSVPLQTSC